VSGKGHIGIGDRNFEVTKSLDLMSANFTICEIAIQSEPSDQAMI
jgi:hypothetical protein